MKRALVLLAACNAASVQGASYPTGAPYWQYNLVDGIPNGIGRVWHENGQLRSEGPYRDGNKHGRFRFYDDAGVFEHQAVFVDHVEVWRSDDPKAEPPGDIVARLDVVAPTRPEGEFDQLDPTPLLFFSALDHAASPNRAGVDFGLGDVRRLDVFATYARGRNGVYGQLLETDVTDTSQMHLDGRRTLDLGGTRRFTLAAIGDLLARAGVVFPVAHDDEQGFYASSAGANVNPTDAATSFPSTFALRTSASLTRTRHFLVLQGDAGIDWIVGDDDRPIDPLLRANAGIGIGLRSAVASVQLSSAMLAADPSRALGAVAFAVTLTLAGVWVTGAASESTRGSGQLSLGVGYAL